MTIFLNFLITMVFYPGLLVSIPCRQMAALRPNQWFQELLLTAFTVADICGRFSMGRRLGLNSGNIHLTVLLRALLFPCAIVCIVYPQATDVLALVVAVVFGFLNGYCLGLSLVVVVEIPGMTQEQRTTCGRLSACSVSAGLCAGSFASAGVAAALGLAGA